MEKKNHQILFSAAKLNHFILFTIMLTFYGTSISHGYSVDQAGRLRALWRAKKQTQGPTLVNDKWVVPSLSVEESSSSYDVGKMEDDLIEGGLPGQCLGSMMFKQYGGYVNVDSSKGQSLFYYFVEAINDSSSKPLVLWLNGGPGCSSLGMGAMTEIGPFGVNPDGKTLYQRTHAWNKVVANILFVESPAGVRFSYSNTTFDYKVTGDKRTGKLSHKKQPPHTPKDGNLNYRVSFVYLCIEAQDTYTFLINWFKRYPHYKARDFYIIGESYAGFYIPELADTTIKRNKEVDPILMIQLKGIMIGNGIMNDLTDDIGRLDYAWSHSLISDETYRGLLNHCIMTPNDTKKCNDFIAREAEEIGYIDYYNIYGPTCFDSSMSPRKPKCPGDYDPCESDYVNAYLNLPQVQEALHANRTKLPYTWQLCSHVIEGWNDSPSTMFPTYRRLIASGLRILIYSGDVDAVVPVTSTRYSIDALKLKVVKPWHPWTDDGEFQAAGYKVVYDGLTFTTVRDAGHQVPTFQPRRALALFKMFLAGN
ncbi:unnamed protein product [Camellia sinensis]